MSLLSDAQLQRYRRPLLFLACLQAFLGSGVFYGWPSLYSLFLDAGVYQGECATHEIVCSEQKERLTLVYTVAASVNLLSQLPWGCILDFLGPRVCNLWATTLVIVGFVLLSLSARGVVDQYMLAMCLIAGGGPGAQISLFHLSELFPVKQKNTVLSVVTGAFQLGFIVFLLFRVAHTHAHASLADLTLLYCVPLLVCVLLGAVLWPDSPCIPPDDLDPLSFTSRRPSRPNVLNRGDAAARPVAMEGGNEKMANESEGEGSTATVEEGLRTLADALSSQPADSLSKSEKFYQQAEEHPDQEGSPASEPAIDESEDQTHLCPFDDSLRRDAAVMHPEGKYGSLPCSPPPAAASSHHIHRRIHALRSSRSNPNLKGQAATKDFKSQVSSASFLLCLAWMSICLFWANFYIGTVAEQLYVKAGYDHEQTRKYTDLFTICLPSGVLGIGVFGWLTAELGFFTTIGATSIFGCGYAAGMLYLPLSMQVITFLLYSFHRSFLFSVMFAYLANEFGYRHFGLLSGIMLAVAGTLGLAQYPLEQQLVVKDYTMKHEAIGSGDPKGLAAASFQQIDRLQLWTLALTLFFAVYVLWKQKVRVRKVEREIDEHTKQLQQSTEVY